jgi:hypothetical protein
VHRHDGSNDMVSIVVTGSCYRFLSGTPLRTEIEATDPDGPVRATETSADAIAAYLGGRSPDFAMRALVIEATQPT